MDENERKDINSEETENTSTEEVREEGIDKSAEKESTTVSVPNKKPNLVPIISAIVAAVAVITVVLIVLLSGQNDNNGDTHTHNFGNWIITQNATCTDMGEQERSCSCGEKETQSIDATGHTEVVDAAVAPACNATGLTEGKHCSVCNETIVAQEVVAKLEHTPATDAAVEATCSATGLTEGSHCSVCNTVITAQQVVAKKAHTTSDWITDTEATCSVAGAKHKECTVCHTVLESGSIDKVAHTTVTDSAVSPTYTSTGLTEGSHCSVCNTIFVEQRTISKIWDGTATKPTKMVNINGVYYYEISTAEEFAYIGELANNTNYILTCDIAMNWNVLNEDKTLTNEPLKSWSPKFASIGGDGYSGTFNGNGHCIYGVYISGSNRYCGIFGRVFGEIVNLNVKDSYIKGGSYTGGICGILNGKMEHCTFDGYVCGNASFVWGTPDGGTGGLCGSGSGKGIIECTNLGTIEGVAIVGGIVGLSYSNDVNNINYGQISGLNYVGGICGFVMFDHGPISCSNYGVVSGDSHVGGITGASSNCTDSSNYANVSGLTYIGGITGHSSGKITSCNNYANVNGSTYIGGIVGYANSTISKCYNQGNVRGDSSAGGVAGEADIFFGDAKISETYYLKNESINNDINGIGNASDTDSGCATTDTPRDIN